MTSRLASLCIFIVASLGFYVIYQWSEFNVSARMSFPSYLTMKSAGELERQKENNLKPKAEITEGWIRNAEEAVRDGIQSAREVNIVRLPNQPTKKVNNDGPTTQSVKKIDNVETTAPPQDKRNRVDSIQYENNTQVSKVQKESETNEYNKRVKERIAGFYQTGQTDHKKETELGSCSPAVMGENVTRDKFQKISNVSYVYSAYYDGRPESGKPSVRVIGVVALDSTMFCHLWFKGDDKPVLVEAQLMIIKHFEPVTYENAIINCPFNGSEVQTRSRVPSRLVMSSSKCGHPDAILDVIDNSALKPDVNFTVCLHKALIRNYNNSNELVEWIEMNRILGAQRFLIYNYTGGSALTPFLRHYVNEGVVELHEWNVLEFSHAIPWYMGQGALINDCIYRSMYSSRFLILVDVDEVVVPQKVDTWAEALEEQRQCHGSDSMLVRNTFILKNYGNNSEAAQHESNFEFLRLTHGLNFTYPSNLRTKIIMKPLRARLAGVHTTMEQSDGSSGENCCLSPDSLLLQHYRHWTKPMRKTWEEELFKKMPYEPAWENVIQYKRMEHFKSKLVKNVNKIKEIATQ
ncbi:hypothetical protein CAPTEDRAFT_200116 [Capitella teleta]|uniref:Glycosyltransferase family 92 protein n=1 Tax=Capitella teleta TaxID=283909 RepID=R7V3C9_CAPTE|nr:hypothetical protein CAPTEDRAFT_200116 [Capitella teleta]|eukprot:ELU13059.1 hypothetical protein CAPTEDRAFT_200116 [Capitella teleta]